MNKKLYEMAIDAALRNEYITTSEELQLYIKAIYRALVWGVNTSPAKNNNEMDEIDMNQNE